MHGGSGRAREVAKARTEAEHVAKRWQPVADLDPREVLAFEQGRSAAVVAWLEAKLDALDDDDITRGPMLKLWRDERRHLLDVAAAAQRAGVAEHHVSIAEAQAQLLADNLRGLVRQLGHDPSDPETRKLVGTWLRAIPTRGR